MKNKQFMLTLVLCLFSTQQCQASTTQDQIKRAVEGACIIGTTYFILNGYASLIVRATQIRFAPERALLNHYAYYNGNYWTTDAAAALSRDLKTCIVDLHNKNRTKWQIRVAYDLLCGKPSGSVDTILTSYPFLQHKKDIDWYLRRLKCIRFLRLYADKQELSLLIKQLEYIKSILLSDHDFSKEEQLFAQLALVVKHL